MMDAVKLLLPVLWAVVSTGIGLILYRTSAAFFESKDTKDGNVKRLRLAGSVTIAAVAFAGMWYSTPKDSLNLLEGYGVFSNVNVAAVRDLATRADNRALELQACFAQPPTDCTPLARDVKALTGELQAKAETLKPTAGR